MSSPPTILLPLTLPEAQAVYERLGDESTHLISDRLVPLIKGAGSASYGPPVTRYLIIDPDDQSTRWHVGDGDWTGVKGKAKRYDSIEDACADIRDCDNAQVLDLMVVVDVDAFAVEP